MSEEQNDQELIEMTVEVVSAYVSHNAIAPNDLPGFIENVHKSISSLNGSSAENVAAKEPAVPIRKSITNDYIICLEDGKKFKSLRRHLRTHYDMSPEEYRAKWGLPSDYPMVAPSYSETRSKLAKDNGLGRKDAANKRKKAA